MLRSSSSEEPTRRSTVTTAALLRVGYSAIRATTTSPSPTPRRAGESSSGTTKKSRPRRASSGTTAPSGPACSKQPRKVDCARVITPCTSATFSPPRAGKTETVTSSPFMASRRPRRATRKLPSGVSTVATPGLVTRSVPVSVGERRMAAFPPPRRCPPPRRAPGRLLPISPP